MPEEGPGPGRFAGGETTPRTAREQPWGADESVRESEHAARLLRYLRDLARARRRPSRDLAGHDHVHWLSELPRDVYVETDAGPGDVLFSVPVIPLTPPVVLEEFDGWLGLRNWYRVLRDLAGQEVVLATGLLTWRPAVRDHLLNTPVRIVVDERTERIDVVLAGRTTLRDRELLTGHPGYRPAGRPADAVHAGQGFGLNASVGDVLRTWCSAALDAPADFREDWAPDGQPPAPVPRLRLAPALVVRPPGRRAVADYHAALLDRLAGGLPEGFARLVSPSAKPQVMQVPEREDDTVAEMLAGLLARGHRVLVATSGATASGALRAALPPGLAGLTVADPTAAGAAADAILDRTDVPDPDDLAGKAKAAEREVAEITERLRGGAREEPGERRERLRAEAPGLAWMPVRPEMPPGPPISRSEAAELVALLAEETAERKARTEQRDIDPGGLPSAAYVRTLIEAEQAAAERAERSKTDLSQRLRENDVAFLAQLDGAASVVAAALHDLGLDGNPSGWNSTDLAAQAFGDALAERRPLIWARVGEMTARAQWAEGALTEISGHQIDIPGDADLRGLAASAHDLRTYLAGGGSLKRGPLRSSAQRQAEPLLATVKVDGAAPTTPELLDLVHTDLMVRITCRELQYVWEAAGISFPADLPPTERVARFVRAHGRLARVREAVAAVNETRDLLDRTRLKIPLGHPHQWHSYVTALRNALEGLGVSRAAADLDALRDSIGSVGDDDPPEIQAALDAIDARDAAAYGRALGALAEARHERSRQIRCGELLARVRAVHPDLANLMIATDGDEVWQTRVPRWDEAWTWAHNAAREAVPAEDRLRASLAEAEERLQSVRADLTAARAWTAALDAVPASPTTPFDVVPVWILPLWRIPETIPPVPDSFDVVIVDGEHEAGAEALFLLWLAPRIILVGPPGPDLAPLEGPPPSTPLPRHLQAITPTTTLFTALTAQPPPPAQAPRPSDTTPDPGIPTSTPKQPPTRPPTPTPRPRAPVSRPSPPQPPARDRDPRLPEQARGTRPPEPPPSRPSLPPRRLDAPRLNLPPGAAFQGQQEPPAAPPVPPRRLDAPPRRPASPEERQAPAPAQDGAVPPPQPHEDHPPSPRPGEDLPSPPRPREDRPPVSRPGEDLPSPPQPREDRPPPPRPREDRPPPPRPREDRPPPPRPREDRPPASRPREDRPPVSRPREDLPSPPQPREDRPPPPRPREDRPPASRPREDRPPASRPREDRSPASRPREDLPSASRPHEDRQPPPRPREDRPPRSSSVTRSDIPAIWGKPGGRPEPPEAQPDTPESVQVRRGQSIAAYKRPELIQIVGRIAAREPDLSDEQIIELVTRLLDCPEDESLLVGARLRYAVEAYRKQAGRGETGN